MQQLPPVVLEYLDSLRDRVVDVLGDSLVGVYTTGSIALGGYSPGRSDIDVMAVADPPVGDARRRRLAASLDHRALPCPATGLELMLYPREAVTAPTTEAAYLLDLNTGAELPARVSVDPSGEPAFWYVIDRAITYQSGRPLCGPSPRELFEPLEFSRLLPVVIESVLAQAVSPSDLIDNVVLNASRALRYGEDRVWLTKSDAGRRTAALVPEFAPLIDAAMAAFRRGRAGAGAVDLRLEDVSAFRAHVLDRLRLVSRSEA